MYNNNNYNDNTTNVSFYFYKAAEEKMKPFSKNNLFCICFCFLSVRETKGKRIIMAFNNRIIKARYTSAAKCLAYGRKKCEQSVR